MKTEIPQLTAAEVRVLGTLIEKSKITPDYYPMTINALTAACNQKTSRYPVVDYSEELVMEVVHSLKGLGLVATAVGGGSRTVKYKHNFNTLFEVNEAELSLLCLLFLRGAQTAGELNTNSGRLYEFSSLSEVLESLTRMTEGTTPFVKALGKMSGQKEGRYIHLFSEYVSNEENTPELQRDKNSDKSIEERLSAVEAELASLKASLAKINTELFGE